jgi:AI-2 transport protein TqsA
MMEKVNNESYSGLFKYLLIGASFIIIVAGMKAAKTIMVPFLLSIFISVICSPLLFWLRRKGLPMWAALLTVIAMVLLGGVLFVMLTGASLNNFSQSLPLYQQNLHEKISEISLLLKKAGVNLPDKEILGYFDPGAIISFTSSILSGLGGVLSDAFLIFITVIFILLEEATFNSKLSSILCKSKEQMCLLNNIASDINHYMAIKTWISLGVGVFVTIWLVILGIDYPILWGLLAFIMNYIPVIGSIIAAVPVILLALVQVGILQASLAAAGFVAIHIIVGNILEPRIMGKGLGLSTLIVFLSLVFWGYILGPVGMLLSVPLTMVMKIAFSSSEETRWIGTLMDSRPIAELFDDDDDKDDVSEVSSMGSGKRV